MTDSGPWSQELDDLHQKVTARVAEPAEWGSSASRAREVSVAAAMLQAFTAIADELHDAAIDDLPADVAEALARFAPGIDLSLLDSYPKEALAGLTNALKGALFELQVADGIDSGAIPLPDGVAGFRLVEDFNTAGYDAQLLDAHDHVIEVVQLKTSGSDHIIQAALRKYPGIDHFMASHEAATAAASHGIPHVQDTGIVDSALTDHVAGALVDQATTSAGEVIDEIIPQFTLAIIAARCAHKLYKGQPRAEVMAWGRHESKNATITSAIVGLAATATGTDAVRIPTVIGIHLVKSAVAELDRSTAAVGGYGDVVDQLLAGRI